MNSREGGQGHSWLINLAARFIHVGIEPVYSAPFHPEQNGRRERMRRELKRRATCLPGCKHSLRSTMNGDRTNEEIFRIQDDQGRVRRNIVQTMCSDF